ncbi:MAG: hypothetical protein Q4E74_06510 [Ruminococcus sp.]|nr:hypothetical protein [Ruminococcus sp.]
MSNENKVLGAVGAVIGAVLGIVVWCLIGKLGYISWIGGFAISVLTLGGYMLLGKDVSKFGLILSVVIMIVSVYFATRLNWAISLQEAFDEELGYDMSLWDCFSNIMKWVRLADSTARFYLDLGLGYLLTFAAGFSFIKKKM